MRHLLVERAIPWARRTVLRLDVGVMIAAAALVVAAYVFVHVVDEVVEGETDWVDRHVIEWVARHPGPSQLEEFMRDCTAFGGTYVLVLVTLATGGFLLIRRDRHALGFLLSAVLGAFILSMSMKYFFDRPRPQILEHRSHTLTSSFPSGHSMLSASVWLTLGVMLSRLEKSRYLKAYFIVIAILISFLTGISRVYLGVHWPTDVLAGWMAGIVWAMACFFTVRFFQHRGKIEPPTASDETPVKTTDGFAVVPVGPDGLTRGAPR